jgi:hypothetical protein
MATIAVFGVLAGGGAYAASKIGTEDLQNKAVTAKKLAADVVTAGKIADGAVETPALAAETQGVALAGAKISPDGHVISWFNRLGGAPTVTHVGTGVYDLAWPGSLDVDFHSAVQVATVETVIGGEAAAGAEATHGEAPHPRVVISDSAGTPVDRSFNYVVFAGNAGLG